MKNTIEEIAWISRIALFNDERAFGKLLDKYHAAVRRIMLAQTGGDEALSDDLVQEVFIKVWLNIGNFKMSDGNKCRLYINKDVDAFVEIRLVAQGSQPKADLIFINRKTVEETKTLYEEIFNSKY